MVFEGRAWTKEQRLLLAVLIRVLYDCWGIDTASYATASNKREIRKQARLWLLSDSTEPFSFSHLIDALSLNYTQQNMIKQAGLYEQPTKFMQQIDNGRFVMRASA